MLVIDDGGDRKDGTKTAHVGHQWLGRYGNTDNGVVTVTTVWADERLYYPVHAVPYTPAKHFAKGKNDPAFRTKLAIGADLAVRARAAAVRVPRGSRRQRLRRPGRAPLRARRGRAAVRDGAQAAPRDLGLRPGRAHPVDAGRALAWGGPDDQGDWHPVTRTFRDGHTETWYAAEAALGWWGRDGARRLVAATADPGALPGKPPGIWSPTCPGPAARARQTAPGRLQTWPRSCGSTDPGTGWNRATSRSETSWAGPTSRSGLMLRSPATRCWSTVRSASAGTPGSLKARCRKQARHRGRNPAAERGPTHRPVPGSRHPRLDRAVEREPAPLLLDGDRRRD